jgi:hypothetical protein
MYPSSHLGDFDFGASFGNFGADFGRFFEFGPTFDAGFKDFLEGLVSVGFDDASVDGSGCPRHNRRVRRPNHITALRACASRHGTGILLVRG